MSVADNIAAWSQDFTNQSSVVVTHNLGRYPIVQVNIDNTPPSYKRVWVKVQHNSLNQFTIDFGSYTRSGKIVYE